MPQAPAATTTGTAVPPALPEEESTLEFEYHAFGLKWIVLLIVSFLCFVILTIRLLRRRKTAR